MRITIGQVLKSYRCSEYPDWRVLELAAGRKCMRPRTIAKMGIPKKDIIWLFVDFMTDEQRICFIRRCALDVVHLWKASDVVRRFLETGDESLRDAARDSARVVKSKKQDATMAASRATALAACSYLYTSTLIAWKAALYGANAASLESGKASSMDDAYDKYISWCVEYLEGDSK
jgi:hypothetical protein